MRFSRKAAVPTGASKRVTDQHVQAGVPGGWAMSSRQAAEINSPLSTSVTVARGS